MTLFNELKENETKSVHGSFWQRLIFRGKEKNCFWKCIYILQDLHLSKQTDILTHKPLAHIQTVSQSPRVVLSPQENCTVCQEREVTCDNGDAMPASAESSINCVWLWHYENTEWRKSLWTWVRAIWERTWVLTDHSHLGRRKKEWMASPQGGLVDHGRQLLIHLWSNFDVLSARIKHHTNTTDSIK